MAYALVRALRTLPVEREIREMRVVTLMVAAAGLLLSCGSAVAADFVYPETGRLSVPYGAKTPGGAIHHAIDVAGASGTPVVAARAGRVTFFGPRAGYGTLMVVSHEQGFETYYAYLSMAAKFVGATVKQGETIAYQGDDHIHFELRRHGARLAIPGRANDKLTRGQPMPVSFAALHPAPAPAPPPPAPSPAPPVATGPDGARVVSFTIGKTLAAGASATWTVVVENTGTSTWGPGFKLGVVNDLQGDACRFIETTGAEANRVYLPGGTTVAPGGRHGFSFAVKAPATQRAYKIELRMVHELVRWFGDTAATTVTVTKATVPAPVAGPWEKAGLWCVNTDGFSTQLHGDLMVKNKISWVAVLVHDGLTENARNAGYFQSGWIAQLRAKGVAVGAWGVQRTDPEGEAKLAAKLVQKWGFDFYIADAEAEYKYTSPSGAFDAVAYGRSKRFVAAFRALMPKLPAALSTYGRADMCDIDWAAWRGAGFVYLPQTYWNEFDIYQPSECVKGAVKAGWPKNQVFPTIGIWGGGQRKYVSAADYVADLKKGGTVGFSVYVGESMALSEWDVFGPAVAAGLAR